MPEFKKEGYTGRENGNPKNAGAFGSGGVPQEGTVAEFVKFFCNMDGENVEKLVYLDNKIHGMPVKLAALKKTELDQDASDSTYLTEARKKFLLGKGQKMSNLKGEEVGRQFKGVGPHEGETVKIALGGKTARITGKDGAREMSLEDLKSMHKESLKGYASGMAKEGEKSLEKLKMNTPKEMSEENVSKLAASLKSMKKNK